MKNETQNLQPADFEREKSYQMVEDVNEQLNSMSLTTTDLLQKLNSVYSDVDQENTLAQIVTIMNAHLNSLMWIDHTSSTLQSRLLEAKRIVKTREIEQDRLIRIRREY